MTPHITTRSDRRARLALRTRSIGPRPRCAECGREEGSSRFQSPLYQMNGRRFCAACLHAWCLSLPEVRDDLVIWSTREQEG
jgi:hypothetical protein